MNHPRSAGLTRLLVAALLTAPLCASAQPAPSDPDTQQIIEALTPPGSAPRTRGMRNLIVREKAAETAASAPEIPAEPAPPAPSVSMAIQFDFDSARLRPQGEAALDKLSAALRSPQLSGSRFLIEGHTDAKGAPAYNLRLSQARADEVRRYLLAQGVTAERVEAVGRGAQDLADPSHPHAAPNRRVRVVNLNGGATR